MLRTTLLLAIAVAILTAPLATADQPPATPLDTFITQKMDEAGMMGVGAAVIVDNKVVWMKGYGFADKARAVPFTPATIMNIASISKTFTGAAMMRTVQDGKLSLDEDINTYLPFRVVNPHHPNEKITLRHLATHTSGITDRWAVYKETYHFGTTPQPLGDFLKSYFVPGGTHYSTDNFLKAKPGTHQEYSNIGAGLAGFIVEVATGKKLNVFTKERLFAPLGMKDTGWFLSEVDPAKVAKLYVAQNGFTIPIERYELTTYPDGAARTSVADLAKFFIALLSDPAYEEMRRFQFTEANKPENITLAEENSGLFWSTKFNVTRVGHGGSDPGLKTEMLASLSKDVGVILFSNTSLSGEDRKHYVAIFRELFKHGEAMRK